jgi:hypothetical protein
MAQWGAAWLVKIEGKQRLVPAFEFLKEQPRAVREQLLAIVDAVRTVGPDQWRDANSHRAMKDEIDHLHEARDKHGETLYRLFLMWQRTPRRVIFIDGRSKANETTLAQADYDAIRDLAATIGDDPPLATPDDFARVLLEEGT